MATRILYVITKANWGGAQHYVYDLAVAAKAAGNEVAVAYGEPGDLVIRLEAAGIRTIVLGALTRDVGLLREWRALRALRSMLRSERPDVVHLNSSKAAGLGALAARLERVPHIIFTAHGWAFNEERPWWQRSLIYLFAWATILLSHKTICVSWAIHHDARWMPFTRHKLTIIYNGVREAAYKSREEARKELWPEHESGVWIGMLSELHPTKRVENAVEAFAHLRKVHPETRLVVLGEGEERARLEWLIRESSLAGYAHLAGFVPDGASCLHAFDIFLHTSRSEALGNAVIEAGLAGLPVVATAVGGIPEIVADGKSGLLVSPYAPEEAAEALIELIEDPTKAKRLGETLREKVRAQFDAGRMVRETLALYTSSEV